jgi:putative MFS transporter
MVGGLGAVGGYFAASGFSAWLVPILSWRILWLINLPTGLLLIAMGGLIPESAKFLLSRGRGEEAKIVMARFGTRSYVLRDPAEDEGDILNHPLEHEMTRSEPRASLWSLALIGQTIALSVGSIAWGLINFGLLLWLPGALVERGYTMEVSSRLLAESALIAVPTVFICALMYSRWSTRWSLVTLMTVTLAGLAWVLLLEVTQGASPVLPVALLIVGSNGLLAMLLPYTSECYPLKVRGRATGWVAACTKGGGVVAQSLSITALVPSLGVASLMIMVPVAVSLALICIYGRETRGVDLRELDGPDVSPA